MIDTHAHLYIDHFSDDLPEVLDRASDAKVERIYLPNIDSVSQDSVFELAERYRKRVFPMVGLHPCSVKENWQEELVRLKPYVDRSPVAIGEIGIDLYWDTSTKDWQEKAFRLQIGWARERKLPFVIHSRDSLDLTIRIVEEEQDGNLRGIFHCFNGTREQGERIVELGFLLGIGGVVTFKNAGVDVVVKDLPLDSMVLETDAPYLTPVPFRGKRNEPAYIPYVAEKIAEMKGVSVAEVDRTTTKNALQLYHPENLGTNEMTR